MYSADKVKIIRDPVHGYISLSEFQLKLIDTPEFQRLKDIRQLTCQHVYPSARHTRFEHSLGVMELTRQAIKHINDNDLIEKDACESKSKITEELAFLTVTAALLHDIGHSPFSHMGEIEMNGDEISETLKKEIKKIDISLDFSSNNAKHEQMSCIVILRKLCEKLKTSDHFSSNFKPNIEFVLRCILGVKYVALKLNGKKWKNLLIGLVNSQSFDMDKLDYIMRDSYTTAIGAPQIDTKRLFRNMFIADVSGEFRVVFTSKAVPSLQNLIEARDGLYIWVYNHHTVVYSDFIYSYIFRRLSRNAGGDKVISPGKIPRDIFFSVKAIVEDRVSDSDIQSELNKQTLEYEKKAEEKCEIEDKDLSINNLTI